MSADLGQRKDAFPANTDPDASVRSGHQHAAPSVAVGDPDASVRSAICLQLFPWRLSELETGALFEFVWRYELPIAVTDLWHYLIDSSRLNKAVGYEGIIYSEHNGLLYGARGEGKFREEWIEYPFEWTKPWYVNRIRKYS